MYRSTPMHTRNNNNKILMTNFTASKTRFICNYLHTSKQTTITTPAKWSRTSFSSLDLTDCTLYQTNVSHTMLYTPHQFHHIYNSFNHILYQCSENKHLTW